jgi:hypothetical protein
MHPHWVVYKLQVADAPVSPDVVPLPHEYNFAHGTDFRGLLGILKMRRVLRSTEQADGVNTWGFFTQAQPWGASVGTELAAVSKAMSISKGRQATSQGGKAAGLIAQGIAKNDEAHQKVNDDVTEEQMVCQSSGICRAKGCGRYCIREDLAQLQAIFFTTLRDNSQSSQTDMYTPRSAHR